MRKLIVLCLAVGLALASSGQWIGHSQAVCRPIPNPQPGVFPFTPELLPGTDTMYYDDGTAAQSWYWFQAGNGWGMKFISPSDNVTLAGALIYPTTLGPNNQAIVNAYTDDGPNGSPGTRIFSDTVNVTPDQWNLVPISVPVVASNFYIFYIQANDSAGGPMFAIDAANNAPQHRKWNLNAGTFSEDRTPGDWLIRAVLDWTPQDTNAASVRFATAVISDTVPNINFQIRTTIKNMGSDTLPIGTPVRLGITGPNSYAYNDTAVTAAKLKHGAMAQINFSPAWRIPDVAGTYNIKVWTEAAGEKWPADDTIAWELSCAKWIQYVNESKLTWISSAGPDKATKFDPADFSLQYPIGVTRARAEFYLHTQIPWSDSSFQFLIYGDDGSTLLYESETLEAPAGMPGAPIAYGLDSTLVIGSGSFYVAVSSITANGRPTLFADSVRSNLHGYTGSGGSGWTLNQAPLGEWFISIVATGNYGVEEEGFEPGIRVPNLQITNYPNPVTDQVTLKWQVPSSMPISVNLYDATGRVVRNLYAANDKARVGTLTMDTRSLAAGIYLARLETAKGSATRKLVIDR
jgi:hypothetical protein